MFIKIKDHNNLKTIIFESIKLDKKISLSQLKVA
jgi:hypothetical protein